MSSARKAAPAMRRLRAVAPRKGAAPAPGASPTPPQVSPDAFGERLRALDGMVERALVESGGVEPAESWIGETAEVVLEVYARVAREMEQRSPRELLAALFAGSGDHAGVGAGYDDTLEPFAAPLLRALYRAWWRVEVAGLENVPASGRVLLVANHAGGLFAHDAAMLKLALQDEHPSRRRAVALVDDLASSLPLLGDLVRRCGAVHATPANAGRLLALEHAVIAFPEGAQGIAKPYAERYRVQRFGRDGFVRAALRTGSPVLPVAIIGAEETHPVVARADRLGRLLGLPYLPLTPTFPWLGLLGLVPLPSKWRIEIGAPLPWSLRQDPDAASDRTQVRRLAEDARRRVQGLVVGARRRRGAAFL